MGIYKLRESDFSVRLAVVLFLLVLGYGYIFAFFMVKKWAGLTPEQVWSTYKRSEKVVESKLPSESHSSTQAINLSHIAPEKHTVSTTLLVQDSHIHIIMYSIIAALETLIILGLGWRPVTRNIIILVAFGAGTLDFSGQWMMKFGIYGFAYLTIASGWLMALVYATILTRTIFVLTRKNPTGEK